MADENLNKKINLSLENLTNLLTARNRKQLKIKKMNKKY